jgi:hypothetical protein
MQYTVIGVWLADKPVVTGVVTGDHEVYGGDEETFTEGVWATVVNANDVAQAEQLATTDMIENNI